MTDKTGSQQARGRFKPGQSGNPSGRPQGSRHKATILAEKMMSQDAEDIVKAVIAAARNGDLTAARLILDRIYPPRKDSPIQLDLPCLKNTGDAVDYMKAIMSGVSDGLVTPSEAVTLSGLVDSFVRALEAHDFEARIARLEAAPQR